MSVPTMLELHDTQMSDYPSDIDVPMHSSTSEYWFHTEVTMEDDGHHLHMPKISHLEHESATVEVDMELYDGERENIDYEKADEAGHYAQEGGDVEDVDLYDASHVHTPTTVFHIDATTTPTIDITDDTHTSPLLANNLTSAGTTIGDMNEVAHSAYEGGPGNGISALETPVTSLHRLNTHLGDGFVYVEGSELSSYSDGQTVQEDAVLQPVESAGLPVNLFTETYPDTALDVHADGEVDGQTETSLHFEEHIEVPVLAQSPQSVDHVDHRQRGEHPSELAEEQRGNSADPHEISEGVYIDPPPAVLLSLHLFDQPDVCLFNHPQSSSGSTTPSPEEAENTEQPLMLLLHHQPTLYYEPLASVFDALRQEEYISRIPRIADGEFVLSAYDLRLTVSEDNVYAREVTLHDLNVIHDGTDMSGPLRLQLQSVTPRFIIRYHSLRDQISRLNLATEGGADHTGLAGDEEREETSAQETPEHTQEPIQNAESNDLQEQQPLELSEAGEIYHQETTESLESSAEVIGDTSNFNIEVREASGEVTDPLGNHEAESEDARPLEDELEYADGDDSARFDPEDVGEDLDADATRNIADTHVLAPASAEYTEYEEYPEHQDEYNGTHGEAHSEDPDGQEALGHTEFEEYKEPTTVDEFTAVEFSAPAKGKVLYQLRETLIENDKSNTEDSRKVANFNPESETLHVKDRNSEATELLDLELQNVVAESDSLSVAEEHIIADPLLDYNHSEQNVQQDVNPEPFNEEWDDSLDGEGEPDIYWEEEQDDIVSNESSITLSSTTSKRRHDEVDYEAELALLPGPPGLKRPRVE